jgi:hypothetical protein
MRGKGLSGNTETKIKLEVIPMDLILAKFSLLGQLLFKSTIDDIEQEWNKFVSLLSGFETNLLEAEKYSDSEWAQRAQTVKENLSKIKPYIPKMTNLISTLKSNARYARSSNYIQAVSIFIQVLKQAVVEPIESIQSEARVGYARRISSPIPAKSVRAAEIDNKISGIFRSILSSVQELMNLADSYYREIQTPPQPQQTPEEPTQRSKKVNRIPIPYIEDATAGDFITTAIRDVRRFKERLEGINPNHPDLPLLGDVLEGLEKVSEQIQFYEWGKVSQLDAAILTDLDNLMINLQNLSRKFPILKEAARILFIVRNSVANVIRGGS